MYLTNQMTISVFKNINMLLISVLYIDTEVSFEHPTYTVNEIDGKIESVLVLSNPSSIDITIRVHCIDGSATG